MNTTVYTVAARVKTYIFCDLDLTFCNKSPEKDERSCNVAALPTYTGATYQNLNVHVICS